MKKYVCGVCGYVYDEASGDPNNGIAPGTKWESLGDNWTCPLCGAEKSEFEEQKLMEEAETVESNNSDVSTHDLKVLSDGEMSAVFSNLAKGCEKQFKTEEAACFNQLAEYYLRKCEQSSLDSSVVLSDRVQYDLDAYAGSKATVEGLSDRGALRALVWSEKVSRIVSSILKRYDKLKADLLKDKKIYVCEICGFIYIGNELPEVCPVCKVPKFKINEISKEAI